MFKGLAPHGKAFRAIKKRRTLGRKGPAPFSRVNARGGDKRPFCLSAALGGESGSVLSWIKCGGIREEERYRRVLNTAPTQGGGEGGATTGLSREEERTTRS